jgi:hypothetical protein
VDRGAGTNSDSHSFGFLAVTSAVIFHIFFLNKPHSSGGTTKDDPDKTISFITVAMVEGAHRHDGHSTIPAIEAAAEAGFKPEVVICDTAYGGDFNVD